MQIEKNTVVSFHYVLKDEKGGLVESSRDKDPLSVLIGNQNIIEGLENALIGRTGGDRFEITVPPELAYGQRQAGMTKRVPKKHFQHPERLKPGMQTTVHTQQGPWVVVVEKIGETVVDVDLNHPMAGKTLQFEIEVVDVRQATPEELEHGHAHGVGGHHH